MANTMKIEVLADGQIKLETDQIDPAMHKSADAFLADLQNLLGGSVQVTKAPHGHSHSVAEQKIKAGR